MKSNKKDFISLSQFHRFIETDNHYHQLAIPLELPQKPHLSSISGIFPKERNRYRVILGGQALGDRAIKHHPHLGKYFPRFQLQVIKEAVALILQIVKPIFRRNPNQLCSARDSTERKLGASKEQNTASLKCAVSDRLTLDEALKLAKGGKG